MFGIGLPELAVLTVVGILVFGPDKLPELARQSARMLKRARQLADSARDELRDQLGPDYADLELRDLDPRAVVRRHVVEAWEREPDDVPEKDDRDTPPSEVSTAS
ncbi:sec-independent translocase [Nocardioides mangrovi]|uniref:Sec-independent protein translocase subunit TatB n=1 Tax=Nocardioides mangrovi TaxID=2874580 RepID=A0ABS7UIP9_9ACTN|nr:sec-independent translocase [Nocardioides mangrovi]MBZ5740714.1 Sec-independent protein translocase subunit TatB [Nocardioides mangrovi]